MLNKRRERSLSSFILPEDNLWMPFFRGFYRIRLPKHGRPDIPLLLMFFLRWFPWLFVFGLTITTQAEGSSFVNLKFRIGLNKNKLLQQNFHQQKVQYAALKHLG